MPAFARRAARGLIAPVLAAVVAVPAAGFEGILRVDEDGPLVFNDGLTWETAYRFLADALADAAAAGGAVTEIRVGAGIYRTDGGEGQVAGDRETTFQLRDGLALRGGYAGLGAPDPDARDVRGFVTILSGDLDGDDGPNFENIFENALHVVTGAGTGPEAVLDGFTIAGGHASELGPTSGRGGAIRNLFGSPTIIDCTFTGNRAQETGGAISNILNSSPTIVRCTFTGNQAVLDGGAISNSGGSPMIVDCTFDDNFTALLLGDGGAIANEASSPVVSGAVFTSNGAGRNGGAIANRGSSSPLVTGCVFRGNSATGSGGAMSNEAGSDPVLVNCVFEGNSTVLETGGAMYNRASSPTVVNCTFVGNGVPFQGGGIFSIDGGAATITSCILWANQPQSIFDALGTQTTVRHSDVMGGWFGAGSDNIDADPQFVDAAAGDLRLGPGSPGIDAGDSTAVPADVLDLDGDGDTIEPVPVDLDGRGRFHDDPAAPDTGVAGAGLPGIVDMGPYEFGSGVVTCPADLAGPSPGDGPDGTVNVFDLLVVLDHVGGTSPGDIAGPAPGDGPDGVVNVFDLIAVLAAWGPCPT